MHLQKKSASHQICRSISSNRFFTMLAACFTLSHAFRSSGGIQEKSREKVVEIHEVTISHPKTWEIEVIKKKLRTSY